MKGFIRFLSDSNDELTPENDELTPECRRKIRYACDLILKKLYPPQPGENYNDLLNSTNEQIFGHRKLCKVLHWILRENCNMEYIARFSMNGNPDPSTVRRLSCIYGPAIKQGVKKYENDIVTRLNGLE